MFYIQNQSVDSVPKEENRSFQENFMKYLHNIPQDQLIYRTEDKDHIEIAEEIPEKN